jgi:hypothetical protein
VNSNATPVVNSNVELAEASNELPAVNSNATPVVNSNVELAEASNSVLHFFKNLFLKFFSYFYNPSISPAPSVSPSISPVSPSISPAPSVSPSISPSISPVSPSISPAPSVSPSISPVSPSISPAPSVSPSISPVSPSISPAPSVSPSISPVSPSISPAPSVSSVQTNENVVDSITIFTTTTSVQSEPIFKVIPKFGCSPRMDASNLVYTELDNNIFCFLIDRVDNAEILNFTKEKSDCIRSIIKRVYMPESDLNNVPGVYCTTDKFIKFENTDYSKKLCDNITPETLSHSCDNSMSFLRLCNPDNVKYFDTNYLLDCFNNGDPTFFRDYTLGFRADCVLDIKPYEASKNFCNADPEALNAFFDMPLDGTRFTKENTNFSNMEETCTFLDSFLDSLLVFQSEFIACFPTCFSIYVSLTIQMLPYIIMLAPSEIRNNKPKLIWFISWFILLLPYHFIKCKYY